MTNSAKNPALPVFGKTVSNSRLRSEKAQVASNDKGAAEQGKDIGNESR